MTKFLIGFGLGIGLNCVYCLYKSIKKNVNKEINIKSVNEETNTKIDEYTFKIPTSSEFNDSIYFNNLVIESSSYDTTIVF